MPRRRAFSIVNLSNSDVLSSLMNPALILEESEKLHNKLTTKLTTNVIASSSNIRASSLPLPANNDNNQILIHKNDEIEERSYNQPENYNNDQE